MHSHEAYAMCLQQGDVYMAFEYLEYDLWALANSSEVNLTATHIKTYMKQMLDAIAYMHTNKVRSLTSCLRNLTSEGRSCVQALNFPVWVVLLNLWLNPQSSSEEMC